MTNNISREYTDKDFDVINLDEILSKFVDREGICKTCSCDHRYKRLSSETCSNNYYNSKYDRLIEKNIELEQAVERLTALQTADIILSTTEIKFTIPKEKYKDVKKAMKQSKNSIAVVFDMSKTLVHTEPDIYSR